MVTDAWRVLWSRNRPVLFHFSDCRAGQRHPGLLRGQDIQSNNASIHNTKPYISVTSINYRVSQTQLCMTSNKQGKPLARVALSLGRNTSPKADHLAVALVVATSKFNARRGCAISLGLDAPPRRYTHGKFIGCGAHFWDRQHLEGAGHDSTWCYVSILKACFRCLYRTPP